MTSPAPTPSPLAGPAPDVAGAGRRMSGTVVRRSLAHSRWVSGLKLLLPATALVIVSLVLAWPQIMPDEKRFRLTPAKVTDDDANNLRMLRPRFVGTDEKHRPFTVTADEATQSAPNSPRLQLTIPHADMTMENGAWVTLSAKNGLYHRDAQTLQLKGRVDVYHDSGAEFHTEEALIDMGAGKVTGRQPVQGQGPAGIVSGDGFEILNRGEVVIFTGRSKVVLWPGGKS